MSKYCPMCNEYTNCTDNCDACIAEENKMNELIDRIHVEQKQYLADIAKLPSYEIIGKAYEICWRDEIICLLESTEFDDETLAVLSKTPNLLDTLYDAWISTDVSVHDMLSDVIREFIREENTK